MIVKNYKKPEVISYAHHAYPLGMIRSNKNSEEWFHSNFIHMYYTEGINQFNFLVEYVNNPFIDMRHVYREEFDWICNEIGLKKWICSEIDRNNTFELMVDRFYLSTSEFYQKEHKMHEILVTGYNERYCFYWDYVNGMYQENCGYWDEIVPHNSKLLYGEGIVAKITRTKKSSFKFDFRLIIEQLEDYYYSRELYSKLALRGDHIRYKDCMFGIECIKKYINYLEENMYQRIDYRYLNVFYEHKKCMLLRIKYISNLGMNLDVTCWEELEIEWKKILNLALKYNLKLKSKNKNYGIYLDIIKRIEELYGIEKRALRGLIENLRKVIDKE